MGIIHKLSPSLADMIAAGEVVERPASAVKELVENAIDAGATQISVEIQNGGITYLRVTDNGCGMSAEDAPVAFLRHATSKISTAEDLNSIVTMGFRGEALAAISAVSKIDMLTKTTDSDLGVSVQTVAGSVVDVSPAGCPQGTTIIVRDLFYNTPARMKFLKRDSVEGGYVAAAVQRQALAHPEVSFRLLRDGKSEFSTPGDGKLLSAIYATMGRQAAREMTEVRGKSDGITVQGYVGKPTANRGSRSYQHFFVNGRYVRSRMMTTALEEAYKNQMMVGRFPICVLHITVAPTAVDVNVHPAKTEVKFLREGDVFDAIHYAVLGALNRTPDRPELTLPKQKPSGDIYRKMTAQTFRLTQDAARKNHTLSPTDQAAAKTFLKSLSGQQGAALPVRDSVRLAPSSTGSVPIPSTLAPSPSPAEPEPPEPLEQTLPEVPEVPETSAEVPVQTALEMPEPETPRAPEMEPEQIVEEKPQEVPYRIIGQTMDTYIIVEQGDTLLFFDKHAAHERILFEKFRSLDHEIMSQLLLTPLRLELGQEEAAILLEHTDTLVRLGFELDDFGGGTVLLRSIPAYIDEADAPATLSQLAQDLTSGRKLDPARVYDDLLHTVACKAAIKGGRKTDPKELSALVAQLMARDDIKHCPHGRPVCITLTRGSLERQFGRS